jgi:uncharacterized membrane protein YhaH (DUF805 family)
VVAWAISEVLYVIVALGTFIPSLSAGARRLHDTDRSGWWQLLILVPLGIFVVLILMALEGKPEAAGKWGD